MHLRTAVIQLNSRDNPAENLATVERSLDRAAAMGDVSLVRLLLESGARRDPVANGHTPVSLARTGGHDEIAAMLESPSDDITS